MLLSENDRGETLVELLLTIVIMGIAVAAIIGGLMTSIQLSDVHRKQASAGAYARDFAEAVAQSTAGTGYTACAAAGAASPYKAAAVGYTPPSGFTASVTSVKYWSSTGWVTTPCSDSGLQQVTVQVQSADARATETSVLVVRKPCGQGSTC